MGELELYAKLRKEGLRRPCSRSRRRGSARRSPSSVWPSRARTARARASPRTRRFGTDRGGFNRGDKATAPRCCLSLASEEAGAVPAPPPMCNVPIHARSSRIFPHLQRFSRQVLVHALRRRPSSARTAPARPWAVAPFKNAPPVIRADVRAEMRRVGDIYPPE